VAEFAESGCHPGSARRPVTLITTSEPTLLTSRLARRHIDPKIERLRKSKESIGHHSGVCRFLAQFQTYGEGALLCLGLIISREVLRIRN